VPSPVVPTPELAPLIVRVPVLPSTVPVKVPVSWASNVPSAWKMVMPSATRTPVSTPVRGWTSVAVTIVLPSACLILMISPVDVKLPVPNSRVEAFALAGTSSKATSNSSAENVTFRSLIMYSFRS
jgi:hypothetical protein